MTKRIFRSICFAALSVLMASLVLVMGVLYGYFTRLQKERLLMETALVAHAVANEGIGYFARLDGTMDCRITWIDTDGSVLYDNRSDSLTMENHLHRQEVLDAFENGAGFSTRYSDTLMEYSIYCTKMLPDGTVIRLATSQNTILTLVVGMLQPICVIVAIALALSLALASRLSRSIVGPLNALDLANPLKNREYEELSPLLHRLDYQQGMLRAQSQELSRKQAEFSAVTRSLSEGLVLLGADRTILSINPAAARLLGVTVNCAGADFLVANSNGEITQMINQALSGEKSEATITFPEGDFLISAKPVRTEASGTGAVLLMLDVTQKLRAEQQRREFTANVSHELKTPLHTISGYAELMGCGMVPREDVAAFSEKIRTETKRLTRLVEDILRLSRLDEGGKDIRWETVDLHTLAQEVILSLSPSAESAKVTVLLEGGQTLLWGAPQLLTSVIFNLVDNGIKYNCEGGRVTVTVSQCDTDVVLRVSDTGVGISQEHQERIFERFYRVDKSRSKAVGGTGLGLSIVKHAAQIHGAQLTLESTPGTGTTVTLTFQEKRRQMEKPED